MINTNNNTGRYVVSELSCNSGSGYKTRTWRSFFSFISATSFGWAASKAEAATFTKAEALVAAAAVEAEILARGFTPKGIKVHPAGGGAAVNRKSKASLELMKAVA